MEKRTVFLFSICALNLYFVSVVGFKITELETIITTMSKNSTYNEEFSNSIKRLLELEPNYYDYSPFNSYLQPFNCPSIPPSPSSTTVHKLRPSDIKAVAAIGDSLTAALGSGAKTVFGLLFEYRGESWSVGGDDQLETTVTMPNILRKFNPKVVGISTGKDFSLFDKNTDNFNVAVSGNEANHIPDQARQLVERIKSSTKIDYKNDWKLITLFIGGNDLCDFCKDRDLHKPEAYINYVKEALDILYAELPKTFVNLVTVLRVNEVKDLNQGLICKLLHHFECPCAAYPENEAEEKLLEATFEQYVNYTQNLVLSDKYERDDFTVVIQPFMEDMKVPRNSKNEVDLSFFAPDCFHFSRKGHSQAAIALWNNMFTPVGRKATSWNIEEAILCPDPDRPYLSTRKNSI